MRYALMRDGYTWVDLRDLRGDAFTLEECVDGEILLRHWNQKDDRLIIVTHDGLGFVAYTPDKEK